VPIHSHFSSKEQTELKTKNENEGCMAVNFLGAVIFFSICIFRWNHRLAKLVVAVVNGENTGCS
jgi:hypothetical protein